MRKLFAYWHNVIEDVVYLQNNVVVTELFRPGPDEAQQYAWYGEVESFSFKMKEVESTASEFELEIRQTGWKVLHSSRPNVISVWESLDGTKANAVRIAVGVLNTVPGNLFLPKQTLTCKCAPLDIDEKILAFAKDKLGSAPETDLQFSDADINNAETYLLGRSMVYRVDPATHVISVVDEIVGSRVVDMTGLDLVKRIQDEEGPYDRPVSYLRARVNVAWTHHAAGEVDIAGQISTFFSLDPNINTNLANHVVIQNGDGWTLTDSGNCTRQKVSGQKISSGSIYKANTSARRRVQGNIMSAQGGTEFVNQIIIVDGGSQGSTPVSGQDEFGVDPLIDIYQYEVQSLRMGYEYTQNRSETSIVSMHCPVSRGVVQAEDDAMIDLEISEIFIDKRYPEYAAGTFEKGDIVRRAERYYRCREDHESTFFDQIRPGAPGINVGFGNVLGPAFNPGATYWERYYPEDALDPATTAAFFRTPRGQLSIRHVACRLRKQLLRRARHRHITAVYRWEDARHLRMEDSVQILIDWGDGTKLPVRGKVFAMEKEWDGKSNPLITVEIAVCFGVGRNPYLDLLFPDYEEQYFAQEPYAEPGVLEFDVAEGDLQPLAYDYGIEPGQQFVDYIVECIFPGNNDGFPRPQVPVDGRLLGNSEYAVTGGQTIYQADQQLTLAANFLLPKTDNDELLTDDQRMRQDVRNVSVEYGTAINMRMTTITTSAEDLHLDYDWQGIVMHCPQGAQLGDRVA